MFKRGKTRQSSKSSIAPNRQIYQENEPKIKYIKQSRIAKEISKQGPKF
jgi:hypothetical protein